MQRLGFGCPGIPWEPAEDPWEDAEAVDAEADGMENLNEIQKKQRFGPDLRLMEVASCLKSVSNEIRLIVDDSAKLQLDSMPSTYMLTLSTQAFQLRHGCNPLLHTSSPLA